MDFYHDRVLTGLDHLNNTGTIPEWVKQSSVSTKEELDELPDTAFAWPEKRMFPMHTKAAAYMSISYFLERSSFEKDPPAYVKDNLIKASAAWGIEKDVLRTANALLTEENKASQLNDKDYGLVTKYAGHTLRKYPLPDERHLKVAMDHFSRNYTKYPISWRRQICKNLLTKQSEFRCLDVRAPAAVQIYGGDCVCDSVKLAYQLGSRASLAADTDPSLAKKYLNLAKGCVGCMSDPVVLEKTAESIAILDVESGLDKEYRNGLLDPYAVVYNLPIKIAQAALSLMNIGGDTFSLEELESLGPEPFAKALGTDFVDEISEDGKLSRVRMMEVIPTLPKPEVAMLKKVLSESLGPRKEAADYIWAG